MRRFILRSHDETFLLKVLQDFGSAMSKARNGDAAPRREAGAIDRSLRVFLRRIALNHAATIQFRAKGEAPACIPTNAAPPV